jgi:hypothetical protein
MNLARRASTILFASPLIFRRPSLVATRVRGKVAAQHRVEAVAAVQC